MAAAPTGKKRGHGPFCFKFIRQAKALQAMTENQNFTNYLEDGITKATQERAKFGQG
jgi:hypothetical protein